MWNIVKLQESEIDVRKNNMKDDQAKLKQPIIQNSYIIVIVIIIIKIIWCIYTQKVIFPLNFVLCDPFTSKYAVFMWWFMPVASHVAYNKYSSYLVKTQVFCQNKKAYLATLRYKFTFIYYILYTYFTGKALWENVRKWSFSEHEKGKI